MKVSSATPMFLNLYRDKDRFGRVTESILNTSHEQGVGEPDVLTSLDEVKADIYTWLRCGKAEYLATLSNDGINHTPELTQFASDMEDAISRAGNYDIDPADYQWSELEAVIEDTAPDYKVAYCEEHGETYYTRRGF